MTAVDAYDTLPDPIVDLERSL